MSPDATLNIEIHKKSVRIKAPNSVNASKRKHKNQINHYNKQRRVLMANSYLLCWILFCSDFGMRIANMKSQELSPCINWKKIYPVCPVALRLRKYNKCWSSKGRYQTRTCPRAYANSEDTNYSYAQDDVNGHILRMLEGTFLFDTAHKTFSSLGPCSSNITRENRSSTKYAATGRV